MTPRVSGMTIGLYNYHTLNYLFYVYRPTDECYALTYRKYLASGDQSLNICPRPPGLWPQTGVLLPRALLLANCVASNCSRAITTSQEQQTCRICTGPVQRNYQFTKAVTIKYLGRSDLHNLTIVVKVKL